MQNFLRICTVISITIAALKLGLAGLLTPGWVVFIILCSVAFLAGGRRVIIITAAIASLALFARVYGGGNMQATNSILLGVLTLVLVFTGIYFMFRALL